MKATPRTDAAKRVVAGMADEWVPRYISEELEREINELLEKNEMIEIRHSATMMHTQTVVEAHKSLERELAEAQEQRDTLAAAMIAMLPFIEDGDYPNCSLTAFHAAIMKYKASLALLNHGT